jgi:hypothetical protein
MVTTMPVPIEFRLPDGWTAADPDAVGAPGAAFVALHTASRGPGFTTNITVDGEYLSADVVLTQLAEESIERLQEAGASTAVVRRTEVGTHDDPGLTQVLRLHTVIDEKVRDLVQCQVYLGMSDVTDHEKHALVRLVLTSTEGLYDQVLPDFQKFVSSISCGTPAPE